MWKAPALWAPLEIWTSPHNPKKRTSDLREVGHEWALSPPRHPVALAGVAVRFGTVLGMVWGQPRQLPTKRNSIQETPNGPSPARPHPTFARVFGLVLASCADDTVPASTGGAPLDGPGALPAPADVIAAGFCGEPPACPEARLTVWRGPDGAPRMLGVVTSRCADHGPHWLIPLDMGQKLLVGGGKSGQRFEHDYDTLISGLQRAEETTCGESARRTSQSGTTGSASDPIPPFVGTGSAR